MNDYEDEAIILEKQLKANYKLEDLLDSNEKISLLKTNDTLNISNYFSTEVIKKLITYTTKMPKEDNDKEGKKYPFNSCEILCSTNKEILNKFFELSDLKANKEEEQKIKSDELEGKEHKEQKEKTDDSHNKTEDTKDTKPTELDQINEKFQEDKYDKYEILKYLFTFFDNKEDSSNSVLSGYFYTILTHLLEINSDFMYNYLFAKNFLIIKKIVNNASNMNCAKFIEKMFTLDKTDEEIIKKKKELTQLLIIELTQNSPINFEKCECICNIFISSLKESDCLDIFMSNNTFYKSIYSIIRKYSDCKFSLNDEQNMNNSLVFSSLSKLLIEINDCLKNNYLIGNFDKLISEADLVKSNLVEKSETDENQGIKNEIYEVYANLKKYALYIIQSLQENEFDFLNDLDKEDKQDIKESIKIENENNKKNLLDSMNDNLCTSIPSKSENEKMVKKEIVSSDIFGSKKEKNKDQNKVKTNDEESQLLGNINVDIKDDELLGNINVDIKDDDEDDDEPKFSNKQEKNIKTNKQESNEIKSSELQDELKFLSPIDEDDKESNNKLFTNSTSLNRFKNSSNNENKAFNNIRYNENDNNEDDLVGFKFPNESEVFMSDKHDSYFINNSNPHPKAKLGMKKILQSELFKSILDVLVRLSSRNILKGEIEKIIEIFHKKKIFLTLEKIFLTHEFNNIYHSIYNDIVRIAVSKNSPESLVSYFLTDKEENEPLLKKLINFSIKNKIHTFTNSRSKILNFNYPFIITILHNISKSENKTVKSLCEKDEDFKKFNECNVDDISDIFENKFLLNENKLYGDLNLNDYDDQVGYKPKLTNLIEKINGNLNIFNLYKSGKSKEYAEELQKKKDKDYSIKKELGLVQDLAKSTSLNKEDKEVCMENALENDNANEEFKGSGSLFHELERKSKYDYFFGNTDEDKDKNENNNFSQSKAMEEFDIFKCAKIVEEKIIDENTEGFGNISNTSKHNALRNSSLELKEDKVEEKKNIKKEMKVMEESNRDIPKSCNETVETNIKK